MGPVTRALWASFTLALALGGALFAGAAPAAAAPCDAPIVNPIACENTQAGQPGERVGRQRRRRRRRSRASRPTSASTRARRSTSRSTRRRRDYRLDIYRMGYYGGKGARKVATVQPSAALPQIQPACLTDRVHRPGRLRQLGGVGVAGPCPPTRVVRHLLRQARARGRDRRREPHRLRRPRRRRRARTCCSRPPTRPGRPTTSYGGNSLYTGLARPAAPTRSATTGRSRPAAPAAEDWVFNAEYPMVRWLERNGYDVSYITGHRHRPARRRAARAQGLPVGRPRRVLVGRAARERRGGARRRREPRVLQRQRGVLEDALGDSIDGRHAVPHAGLLQGDARRTRKIDPEPTTGPAPGATRASARRPTAAARRTR